MADQELDQLCINSIRMLAVDAVQKANSGHPGLPMGAAALAYTVWTRHLRHNPRNPHWPERDRFILSAGHGSMLLYALLYLTGYEITREDLQQFRQWGSKTPGHPESHETPGVEVTTGPLGQGFANGVGMAVAARLLAERFNQPDHEIVEHYIYALVSDGDLQEGVASEAASYAGTQRLGRLIVLYDDNGISIEGETDWTFQEDVGARFRAYGWQVLGPVDGNDIDAVDAAVQEAKADTGRPSLIICATTIGYGSPNKAGSHDVHGAPLGAEEVQATKENLDWPAEPAFYVPEQALAFFRQAVECGAMAESRWRTTFEDYRKVYPTLAEEFERRMAGKLPDNWEADIPIFSPADGAMATRVAGGKVLNAIARNVPELAGGSADLEPSTKTWISGSGRFGWETGGRNLQFGIREHAMGGIAVGMAHHGGVIPYTATFMVFSDYMRPPIRLAALARQRVIFVFTHDSIGVGEDGPTHQPVEHLMALRAIPGLRVIRPADANEVSEAWRQAILSEDGPTAIALSRQNLPVLDRAVLEPASRLAFGAYTLRDVEGEPDVILLATGSEVALTLQAADVLSAEGIAARVVSMPCWELFDEQPDEYRNAVLLPGIPRVAIEAGVTLGWQKYTGEDGLIIGIDRFGASAPIARLMQEFGFTVGNIVSQVRALLGREEQ